MRAVAAALSGAYALLIMTILLPWDQVECATAACVPSDADAQLFTLGFTTIALVIPTLVVMIILRGVLGLRATRDPEAGAVLAALGQTRGTAVRTAALQGLRDGSIAAGIAYVLAGAVHVAMVASVGLNPLTTGAGLWLERAVLAAVAVLALVLSHMLTAAQRPRTPVDALTADMQDDPAPRPSLKVRAMLSGGVLAASGGVIAGLAVSMRDTPWSEVGFVATNAAGIAMITGWAGALALGLWAAVPWLRRGRGAAIALAAAAVGRDSRVGAVLDSYAGDRSRASARIVTVLAGLGFLFAALPSAETGVPLEGRQTAAIVLDGDVDTSALEESYRAIPGVESVIVAEAATLPDATFHSFVFAVSPDGLRGHHDALADALERHPRHVAASLTNGEVPTELLGNPRFDVDGVLPISECCDAFVNADHIDLGSPGSGFLIYATPGADLEAMNEAIDRVASDAPGVTSIGTSYLGWESSTSAWSLVVDLAVAGLVLVLPLTLLAVGAVKRRRQDDATLAALGATARTMRTATALETAVVSAYALAGGMVVGAVTRVLMTELHQGRLSLQSVAVDSPLTAGLDAVGWAAMGTVGLTGVAIMTITAFITAWATARPAGRGRTPVDQLRTKATEGVR